MMAVIPLILIFFMFYFSLILQLEEELYRFMLSI